MVPAEKVAEAGADKAPVLDVSQFGYFKVLDRQGPAPRQAHRRQAEAHLQDR
jgi:hypothetical protein